VRPKREKKKLHCFWSLVLLWESLWQGCGREYCQNKRLCFMLPGQYHNVEGTGPWDQPWTWKMMLEGSGQLQSCADTRRGGSKKGYHYQVSCREVHLSASLGQALGPRTDWGGQIVHETLPQKYSTQKRAGGVAQAVSVPA
jgi:hypothetical protein